MGKISVKANKNIYHITREKLGLSREAASELLVGIPPERIERIESEKIVPHPEDILTMSKDYKARIYAITTVPMNVPLDRNMCQKSKSRIFLKLF